jgi:hypothetical protein
MQEVTENLINLEMNRTILTAFFFFLAIIVTLNVVEVFSVETKD